MSSEMDAVLNGLEHISSTAHLPCCSIECTNGPRCNSNSSEENPSQAEHQHLGAQPHYQSLHSILRRYSRVSRMASSPAGTFEDSMTEIVMDDVPSESEPTTAILSYCKRKFLRPYMSILAIAGLNPISTDTTQCRACLSYLQAFVIMIIIFFGYFLQFLASYRGDRGFTGDRKLASAFTPLPTMTDRSWGEIIFGYILPKGLHLAGFVAAIYVCKMSDKEQLQNLIERVFLMSMKPKRLCTILWVYVGLGMGLLALLFGYVVPSVLMREQIIQVEWMPAELENYQVTVKVALLCTVFTQDLVEIVILTGYCIECYLLRVHLQTLSMKLLMRTVESLDWMREVIEFRKLLDHLNNKFSIPVCFFIVMNLSYAFAGFVFLFKDLDIHYIGLKVVLLNIANVLLWLLMGLLPFFSAASVTRVCQIAQANGHQIRVRPFVYHNTSSEDLNSTLLFASSLNMSAKLFRMPIQSNYLCFAILVISVVILTLGMCLNFSLGIF